MLQARNLVLPSGRCIDLEVNAGECLALCGPSGAGKSRLLRQIADLDPNSAEIALEGRGQGAIPAPSWRQQVVYLQPESGWWADSCGENFSAGLPEDDLFQRLSLSRATLDQPVDRLSSGERQRLAFLRLLPLRPKVLLLDEPTSALDQGNTLALEGILRELMTDQSLAVILTSHDEAQVARMADRRLDLPSPGAGGS